MTIELYPRVVHKIGDGKWTAIGMSENPFMVGEVIGDLDLHVDPSR